MAQGLKSLTLFACVLAIAKGQDLCSFAESPLKWKDQDISVRVKLPSSRHGSAFTPANAPSSYRGRCELYPIPPGTPESLNHGIRPAEGSPATDIERAMKAYGDSHSPDDCFRVEGKLKLAENFKYDKDKGGNGFGFRVHSDCYISAFDESRCSILDPRDVLPTDGNRSPAANQRIKEKAS